MNDAITITGLNKSFKGFEAVKNLSLRIPPHSVFGFLGPNGAGKTTTMRILVGLSKADGGSIKIFGSEVRFGDPSLRQKIGYLPEQPALYPWMRGTEYLRFSGKLYGLTGDTLTKRVDRLMKQVGLWDARTKKVGGYSNGMRQRLGIAQALIGDPEIVILDEPVSALDPIGRREVLQAVEELKQDRTVVMSTHILADVERICDQVAILNHGQLVTQSSLTELASRYTPSVLQVEFERDPGSAISDLSRQPWVESVRHEGNSITVSLQDPGALAKNIPMKYFASIPVSIRQYGLNPPDLEDIFIRLVEDNQIDSGHDKKKGA